MEHKKNAHILYCSDEDWEKVKDLLHPVRDAKELTDDPEEIGYSPWRCRSSTSWTWGLASIITRAGSPSRTTWWGRIIMTSSTSIRAGNWPSWISRAWRPSGTIWPSVRTESRKIPSSGTSSRTPSNQTGILGKTYRKRPSPGRQGKPCVPVISMSGTTTNSS